MKNGAIRLAFPIMLACLLAACAGEKLRESPAMAKQLVERGRQGQAAYFKGDLPRAAAQFELALQDAMRIEDSEGVAIMSINLARVKRESGDSGRALTVLDAVSTWHRKNIALRTHREIDLLSAVVLADLGQRDAALQRLKSLREQCPAECEVAIGIDSLQARLLLEKGEAVNALQSATAAIGRFRSHANQSELANLYRVQGEAQLALGDFAAAKQALESALGIDKSLGQPAKIAQSLEILVRISAAAKDAEAHASYRARLAEVQQARLK